MRAVFEMLAALLSSLYSIVIVTCGFALAFAIVAHAYFPHAPGSSVGSAAGRPANAPALTSADLERIISEQAVLPPETRLPPEVLIRRRWNMPACIARELG